MQARLLQGFRLGEFEIRPLLGQVNTPGGEHHSIHPQAMEVLLVLAESHHEVVGYEQIAERVWGTGEISHTHLSRCVSELRHAFDDHAGTPRFIQTLRNRGYRLVAPIEFNQAEESPATDVAIDKPALNAAALSTLPDEIEDAHAGDAGPASVWEELKRRRVVRVSLAYMAVGWAAVEVTSTIFPLLGVPDWVVRAITVIVVIGFPVAVITAWVFQVSPQGIVIDLPRRDVSGSANPRRFEYAIIGALVIALGIMGFRLFVARVEPSQQLTEPSVEAGMAFGPASIAVLPFLNIGEDPDTQYFSDGLAEELTNLFAKVPEMQVASRTASFYYKNNNEPLAAIAEKLRARYILEGSVRKTRDSIRIMAQLIDAKTGYHLWSNDYDRTAVDIFDIQRDIAAAVTSKMGIALSADSEQMIATQPTHNIEAYDYYLQGRGYLRRPHNEVVLDAAKALFQKAIDSDPRFAEAFAGICTTLQDRFVLDSAASWFEEAEKACNRALTLEPDLPEVRIALGNLYRLSGQFGDAEVEFRQAQQLDPDSDAAALGLGRVYRELGQTNKAEREFKRAIALQPGYWLNYNGLGRLYYHIGDYEQAASSFRTMIELAPDNHTAYTNLGAALYMLGDYPGATDAWRHNVELSPSKTAYSNLGLAEYYAGNFEAAADMQQKAIALAPEDPTAYGRLGAVLAELPGQETTSRANYDQAILLTEQQLQINPDDTDSLTELSSYLIAVGRQAEADAAIERVLELSPDAPVSYYFSAKVNLSAGRLDAALDDLARAVELGYPRSMAAADPQLRSVHEHPRVRVLLQTD